MPHCYTADFIIRVIFYDLKHDDVIKWRHFPSCGELTGHRWIHLRPVRHSFIFSLICAWINTWVNSHEAGNLSRHRAHCDVSAIDCWRLVRVHWATVLHLCQPCRYVAYPIQAKVPYIHLYRPRGDFKLHPTNPMDITYITCLNYSWSMMIKATTMFNWQVYQHACIKQPGSF